MSVSERCGNTLALGLGINHQNLPSLHDIAVLILTDMGLCD